VLGVAETTFRRHIRPQLRKIKVGACVFYDKIDLESWIEQSKDGCDRTRNPKHGDGLWENENNFQGSSSAQEFGTSTNKSMEGGYVNQLEQLIAEKQSKS